MLLVSRCPESAAPDPNKVFPWDDAAPEGELLSAGSDPSFQGEHVFGAEVGEILVHLYPLH